MSQAAIDIQEEGRGSQGAKQRLAGDLEAEMKQELGKRLEQLVVRYEVAEHALSELAHSINHDARLVYKDDALQQVFDTWLDEQIRSFEAAGRGATHATIDKHDMHTDVRTATGHGPITEGYALRRDEASLDAAVKELMAGLNFGLLVTELDRLGGALETKGLSEAADRLVNDLGLNREYGREHPPKQSGRGWVFSRWLYNDGFSGYGYTTLQDLYKLACAFDTAEAVAGLLGIGSAMHHIVGEMERTRERHPSRTKIGEGMAVEATVFKEKLQLRVSPDVGDGLLAFIVQNTTKALVDLTA
jgi:hypothetical protein